MTNVNLEKLIAKAKKEKDQSNLNYRHGQSDTRLYRIFTKMKDRCYNPKSNSYKYYGERGITICDEWINDFIAFYNWAMANGYTDALSIDRKSVDGNYQPSNCKWATPKEQGNNRRDCRYVTINGITQTFVQWCEQYSLPPTTAKNRVYRLGWTEEKALTTPAIFQKRSA